MVQLIKLFSKKILIKDIISIILLVADDTTQVPGHNSLGTNLKPNLIVYTISTILTF